MLLKFLTHYGLEWASYLAIALYAYEQLKRLLDWAGLCEARMEG
jgi:hypothetical protein